MISGLESSFRHELSDSTIGKTTRQQAKPLTKILVESLEQRQRASICHILFDVQTHPIDVMGLQRVIQRLVVRLILRDTTISNPALRALRSISTYDNRTLRTTTQPRVTPLRRTPNHHQHLHTTLLQLCRLTPHSIPHGIVQVVIIERDISRLSIDVHCCEVEMCELGRVLYQWQHRELAPGRIAKRLNVDLVARRIVRICSDVEGGGKGERGREEEEEEREKRLENHLFR